MVCDPPPAAAVVRKGVAGARGSSTALSIRRAGPTRAAIDGEALVAVAATVGRARLIDNTTVRTPARVAAGPNGHERRETECSV